MSHLPITNVDSDLLSTLKLLFPGAHLALSKTSGSGHSYRFVPSVRRTHMLVPANDPNSAAAALDRPSASDTLLKQVRRGIVRAAVRQRNFARYAMPYHLRVGPSTDSIIEYLSEASGRPVDISVAIGPRRANRKPVLAVSSNATPVGYAKVGLTPLANRLIDHEASVLKSLAGSDRTHFRVPTVIHHGRWNTSSVLLMENLQPPRQRSSRRVPTEAMAEIVGPCSAPLAALSQTEWFAQIDDVGERMAAEGKRELQDVTHLFRQVWGGVTIPMGRWHGDLGPWNMAWERERAAIWDWERSEVAPAAIDAVHYSCHSSLRDIGNMQRSRAVLASTGVTSLRGVLGHLNPDYVSDDLVEACLHAYLLAVGARFTADSNGPDGEPVRLLAAWYLAVLKDQLGNREERSWN